MKKLISIVFILIATIFCFKDIVVLVSSDSGNYVMDISEEESSDETEKGDIDEKNDIEGWQVNSAAQLQVANLIINTSFQTHKEKRNFKPYFEICSPPPECI